MSKNQTSSYDDDKAENKIEDAKIKQALEELYGAITTPAALVNRTIERMQGIERGREAEKKLRDPKYNSEGASPETLDKKEELIAEALIGRTLIDMEVPKGQTSASLAELLQGQKKFHDTTASLSQEQLLKKLDDGSLRKDVGLETQPDRKHEKAKTLDTPTAARGLRP